MQSLTGEEPDLELGASGQWVAQLQSRLTGLGYYNGPLDGSYNMDTESAVRMLQSAVGADNDGEMHLPTWQLLLEQEQRYGLEYNHYAGPGAQDWDQVGWQQSGGGWNDQRNEAYRNGTVFDEGQASHENQGQLSDDGQWRWNGYDWVAATDPATAAGAGTGQLSDDGQWQWNGQDWQAADAGAGADFGQTSGEGQGQLSDDGQWRWDGAQWQAADQGQDLGRDQGGVGQLSDDGQWRWNGAEWLAA